MQTSKIAAAVLATVSITPIVKAQPQFIKPAQDFVEVVQCIPAYAFGNEINIQALCDASELNKKYNLEVNQHGCVVEPQFVKDQKAPVMSVSSQAVSHEFVEASKAKSVQLPKCTEFQAFSYLVEL